jgi:putative membrane protein
MFLTIILLARVVSRVFRHHYSVAFHAILGIVLASILTIIPTEYGPGELLLSTWCCGSGFLLAFLLARLDKRIKK